MFYLLEVIRITTIRSIIIRKCNNKFREFDINQNKSKINWKNKINIMY